mmetsp:Transcript_11828/g.23911  ORF Transcript_11828/g.23911 Transcript_11828/m.23911 type:complete len:101 (+) Transcript_11828:193-495(+)
MPLSKIDPFAYLSHLALVACTHLLQCHSCLNRHFHSKNVSSFSSLSAVLLFFWLFRILHLRSGVVWCLCVLMDYASLPLSLLSLLLAFRGLLSSQTMAPI